MVAAVEFYGVSRHYGQVRAVDDVTISVAEGEFFLNARPKRIGQNHLFTLDCGVRATKLWQNQNLWARSRGRPALRARS